MLEYTKRKKQRRFSKKTLLIDNRVIGSIFF
jgi:hypothetical protein